MKKKILVVGGGGREHAIIKALKKSPDCGEIWCAPDSVSGWSTGSALAAQVKDLRQQAAGGWALYRYGSLFGAEAPALAEAECAALRALNE